MSEQVDRLGLEPSVESESMQHTPQKYWAHLALALLALTAALLVNAAAFFIVANYELAEGAALLVGSGVASWNALATVGFNWWFQSSLSSARHQEQRRA